MQIFQQKTKHYFVCYSQLKVVQCDLLNPLELAKHLEGQDAVLSALGVAGLQIYAMTFYEDSMKSIVTAMRNANVKRLICVTAFYTKCKKPRLSVVRLH